jgi:hypothetical protein
VPITYTPLLVLGGTRYHLFWASVVPIPAL